MCAAWAGVAFSNPCPSLRPFATPVTQPPSQHVGQVWPIFPKSEIKGEGREGLCARQREGTRSLYPSPAICSWRFAAWRYGDKFSTISVVNPVISVEKIKICSDYIYLSVRQIRGILLNEIYHCEGKFCRSAMREFFGFDGSCRSISVTNRYVNVDAMLSRIWFNIVSLLFRFLNGVMFA